MCSPQPNIENELSITQKETKVECPTWEDGELLQGPLVTITQNK